MDEKVDEKCNAEKVETKKSMTATIEKSVGGTKKATMKSPGKKAQEIKSDVGVDPKAGTSAQLNKVVKRDAKNVDANPSAPSDSFFQFSWKRPRAQLEYMAVPEKKKLKREELDKEQLDYATQVVESIIKRMPKPVIKPESIEATRREIKTMPRGQLEDLAMQEMDKNKKNQDEINYIRTEMIKKENTLATYRRKIAEISQQFGELAAIDRQNWPFTKPVYTSKAAGQNLGVTVKSESHAKDDLLPLSSGVPSKAEPSNGPESEKQAPKSLPKFRPRALTILGPNPEGGWLTRKPTISSFNKIAASKANAAETTITGNARPRQAADKDVKETETAQKGGKRHPST